MITTVLTPKEAEILFEALEMKLELLADGYPEDKEEQKENEEEQKAIMVILNKLQGKGMEIKWEEIEKGIYSREVNGQQEIRIKIQGR